MDKTLYTMASADSINEKWYSKLNFKGNKHFRYEPI